MYIRRCILYTSIIQLITGRARQHHRPAAAVEATRSHKIRSKKQCLFVRYALPAVSLLCVIYIIFILYASPQPPRQIVLTLWISVPYTRVRRGRLSSPSSSSSSPPPCGTVSSSGSSTRRRRRSRSRSTPPCQWVRVSITSCRYLQKRYQEETTTVDSNSICNSIYQAQFCKCHFIVTKGMITNGQHKYYFFFITTGTVITVDCYFVFYYSFPNAIYCYP